MAVLTKAPTPELGRRLSSSQIAAALRKAGRCRNIDQRAAAIRDALRAPQLAAHRWSLTPTATPLGVIAALSTQIDRLESALAERLEQHPDADIYRGLPGLGVILGARVLAEFGDDPNRYTDAKAREDYAGSSPITKQSGRSRVVLARFVRNLRLADAITWWAFCSLTSSSGARRLCDRHRANGNTHHQALRALSNRWVGILHGCLRHHTPYDERHAWGHYNEHLTAAA